MTFKTLFLLIIVFLLSCNSGDNSDNHLTFKGSDIDGVKFNSKEFEGTPMIINFWYPSCPPCTKEIPTLVEFNKENNQKILMIGIIHNSLVDSKEGAISMLEKFDVEYINLYDKDNSLTEEFNILGFPTTIFLDKTHKVNTKWTGYLDENTLKKESSKISK
mgnify:CR=1 FL=1|tara:strand:+ start:1235 stop:1717 length:483 start_codon:yes stop_codon:yes gene_type:complete